MNAKQALEKAIQLCEEQAEKEERLALKADDEGSANTRMAFGVAHRYDAEAIKRLLKSL